MRFLRDLAMLVAQMDCRGVLIESGFSRAAGFVTLGFAVHSAIGFHGLCYSAGVAGP
jgi:hypothetical protein